MILEATAVARSISRKLGLMPTLSRIRTLWHQPTHEDKFAAALLKSIRPDGCVLLCIFQRVRFATQSRGFLEIRCLTCLGPTS